MALRRALLASALLLAAAAAGNVTTESLEGVQSCPGCQQCAKAGGSCSRIGCCPGFECKNILGSTGKVCTAAAPKPVTVCIEFEQVCAGPGIRDQPCCGGMSCNRKLGNGKMGCGFQVRAALPSGGASASDASFDIEEETAEAVSTEGSDVQMPPKAVEDFQSCPGCQQCAQAGGRCNPMSCCPGFRCKNVIGDVGGVCIDKDVCSFENGRCGDDSDCCDDLRCMRLLGGTGGVCRKAQKPEPVCGEYDQICRGPGLRDMACCGGMECIRELGHGKMGCGYSGPQCMDFEQVCKGPGLRDMPCCGSMHCVRHLGHGKMGCGYM